jgi:hypothetical protein
MVVGISSLTPIMGKYNNSGITTLSINVSSSSGGIEM